MKILKIIFIAIIISLIVNISYASVGMKDMFNSLEASANKPVYASSTEVSPNSEFYLIFNLSKISYNEFSVKIIADSNAVANEVPKEANSVSVINKEVFFVVNKNNITLEKMAIDYIAPEQEGKIEFKVEITNLEDSISKWTNEINEIDINLEDLKTQLETAKSIATNGENNSNDTNGNSGDSLNINEIIENLEKTIEQNESKKIELEAKIDNYTEEKMQETITVNIVKSDEKDNSTMDEMMKKMEQEFEERDMSQMKRMMEEVENLEGNLKAAKDQISALTGSVTYQGSQNNYLSSLSISNVSLKSEFKKTNLTYFAEVENTVNDLTINAISEDSSAIITIYGNTDLKVGQNKIIINVTAVDGSVKTYKIYVEKKG